MQRFSLLLFLKVRILMKNIYIFSSTVNTKVMLMFTSNSKLESTLSLRLCLLFVLLDVNARILQNVKQRLSCANEEVLNIRSQTCELYTTVIPPRSRSHYNKITRSQCYTMYSKFH